MASREAAEDYKDPFNRAVAGHLRAGLERTDVQRRQAVALRRA